MNHKKVLLSLVPLTLGFAMACSSHAAKSTDKAPAKGAETEVQPVQAKGYGDFLFMPPGSIAIRNFLDKDGDGVDDRYQMQPGGKSYPMGHFYKAPKQSP